MKNPNGYGSVIKLSGKRRNPFAVRVTAGFNDNGKQVYKYVSYHKSRSEALIALAEYNKNPYDLNANSITFAELYNRYSETPTLTAGNQRRNKTAFNASKALHDKVFRSLKLSHLQKVIQEISSVTTQHKAILLYKDMYAFALKHDIVTKDYSVFLTAEKYEVKGEKSVYTDEEINILWNTKSQAAEMTLMLLYTGMRRTELAELQRSQVHIEESYIIAGSKTQAGKDRYIPICDKIKPLFEKYYYQSNAPNLFTSARGKVMNEQLFYRCLFVPLMKKLKMKHTVHETRHTFISRLYALGADKLAVQRIVGHKGSDVTENTYTHIEKRKLHETVNLLN